MKKNSHLELSKFRISQILLFVAPITTLMVNPWTNYDPISLPKMLVLVCGAASCLALAIVNYRDFMDSIPKYLKLLAIAFMVFMTSTLLFSGAPLNQQFWGTFGRNTGYLTYFSLLSILVCLVWVRSDEFYKRLAWYFVLSSAPMTAYCLVQIAGKDPIPWSEFNTFGTLGNINFLSAFLGMTSLGAVAFASDKSLSLVQRLSLLLLAVTDLVIIYSTGSIQGPVIFAVGCSILIYLRILNLSKAKKLLFSTFTLFNFVLAYFLVIALQNSGPLARIIYQPSVVFRGDYIHAGFEMTLRKPIFGVGMDTYGDWYREARGEISTLRTGPDRVANTAHNIFLDISSNGGILLGLTYLALVLFALYSGLRLLRTNARKAPHFMVLFSVWVAYQVQALVSINQIGVGIWGWVLTGALIGMSLLYKETEGEFSEKKYTLKRKEFRGKLLDPSHAMIGFLGFALGFILAAIPLNADIKYRAATNSGDLNSMLLASSGLGSTEFHRELVLDFAMRNNRVAEVKEIASGLVKDYPRSFFGWRVLSVAAASTDQERNFALNVVKSLDPFNPDLG